MATSSVAQEYKDVLIATLEFELGKIMTRAANLAVEAAGMQLDDVTGALAAVDAYTRIGEGIAAELKKARALVIVPKIALPDDQTVRDWCEQHDIPIGHRGAIAEIVRKACADNDVEAAKKHFRSHIKRGVKTRLSVEQFMGDTREEIIDRLERSGIVDADELADQIVRERDRRKAASNG